MRIAIIGAGIAGMTTAHELNKRGVQVDVFEKSRGLGGRLSTKRLDWGHIDTGAQYFTARDNRFQQQVNNWIEQKVVAPWDFTPYKVESDKLCRSGDDTIRYAGCAGMSNIVRALAKDISIHFNTHIRTIQRHNGKWRLDHGPGNYFSDYDWVVTSLPAEQSAMLLQEEHVHALNMPTAPHLPCWALALATRGQVSQEIQGIFGDDIISWVSRLSSRPQLKTSTNYDDLWMLHYTPQWSIKNNKDTTINIADTGFQWLKKRLQTPLNLAHEHHHYWRYASVKPSSNKGICVSHTFNLAAIGAWCCGGRVEGAYISAIDLLNEMSPL